VRLALLVAVAACHGNPAGGSVDGAQIFQATCAICHGPAGKPSQMMIDTRGVRDLTSTEFRKRVTPALVEAQVRHGSKNMLMPPFEGALSDAQIQAVAGYVASPKFPGP
jgi:mono/diheme cytochrome c family protein